MARKKPPRKFDVDGLEELNPPPREVWRAVEGDRGALIELLRGNREMSRLNRNAIADWLEGKLTPYKIPRGPRPAPPTFRNIINSTFGGHDITTDLGRAGHRYEILRKETRMKGLHLKNAGRFNSRKWTEELLSKVAKEEGVSALALGNYLKRSRTLPPDTSIRRTAPDGKVTIVLDLTERRLEERREIAREIRRTKNRRKWPKLAW